MRPLRILAAAGFAALLLFLFVQLGLRANRAVDGASQVRFDIASVDVRFDRPAGMGVLREGWGNPVPGEGVWSLSPAPVVQMPTSNVAGDVELRFVLASALPREQPVIVRAGDVEIGRWMPKAVADETVRFTVPRAARVQGDQLAIRFDLGAGEGRRVTPIRILRATAVVLPAGR